MHLHPSVAFCCRHFFSKTDHIQPSCHRRRAMSGPSIAGLHKPDVAQSTRYARNSQGPNNRIGNVNQAVTFLLALSIIIFSTKAHAQQAVFDLSPQPATSGKSRNGLETLYRGSYALVIGASKYRNGWNSLISIPREVEGIAKALEKLDFKVEILHDPSGEELHNKVRGFLEAYGAETHHRLVIYFGGHGYTIHEENDLKSSDTGFLVPVDAPLPFVEKQAFIDRALNMDLIKKWSKEVACKHLLFLFDSCFSGAILQTRSLKFQPRLLENVLDKPVRLFITAGSANQEVPAESLFARAFIKALQGEGDVDKDGFMTGSELGYYMNKTVMMSSPNTSPQIGKLHEGDFDKGDILFKLDPSIAMIPKPIEILGGQDETRKNEATKQGLSNYIP